MSFTIGQRWSSESENELGLGIITAMDNRRVTILFPASGEQRLYAQDTAPLSRMQFQAGDSVTHCSGWMSRTTTLPAGQL